MIAIKELFETAKYIQKKAIGIDNYQALDLAVKIQQNKLFAKAFNVYTEPNDVNQAPPYLEMSARALGYFDERNMTDEFNILNSLFEEFTTKR